MQASSSVVAAHIDAVMERIRDKLPTSQAGVVVAFACKFFEKLDADDLTGQSVADLYGMVLSQWHFVRKHTGGMRLRTYNPSLEQHGWESTHTVVEIVCDDMPFLVDSITMEVNRQGLTLHMIIHPVMQVRRDQAGRFVALVEPGQASSDVARLESIMHVEVDRRADAADLEALRQGLERVLADVLAAVSDWPAMRARVAEIGEGLAAVTHPEAAAEVPEAGAYLQWLLDDNFVLLGCRDYELVSLDGDNALRVQPGSGLGLLRESGDEHASRAFSSLPPQLRAQAHLPRLLTITKSNTRSTVHRSGYLDYIGVKTFDATGRVTGERRLIGLLASTAYSVSPFQIPVLRAKVAAVIERAAFMPRSHAGKALQMILERYPRDELFQIDPDELYQHAMGILRLGERQRTRLFVRRDPFGRFVSCLIYVPRENYNTEQRKKMQSVLTEAFNGVASEFDVHFSESALARILIIVRCADGMIPEVDERELEQRLIHASRRWEDALQRALLEHCGEERGMRLLARYGNGFPAGYREDHSARVAVFDIEQMEALIDADSLGMSLYVPLEAEPGRLNFKLYRLDAPVPLSESLPMLERMGVRVVDELPAEILRQDGRKVWIHDFGLHHSSVVDIDIDIDKVRALFQDTFARVWRNQVENDDFNRLVLLAGLSWREVAMLRAYARYMKQAAFTFSQTYIEHTLAAHPALARRLVMLFAQRFDPALAQARQQGTDDTVADIEHALNQVANLDEDRIIRQFLALILATWRTNFYQRDAQGQPKPYLSFKLDPARIPALPQPLPMFEIFVYSPRMEGVHLRGGKVARGGLRWSDRMEDFRTEILGLVKAQIVKNAVIVPVGSKGGFVTKMLPVEGGREAQLAEGVACYRMFLSGLLDLTDNLVQGQVVPPADVVRHDQDDPYLVVAADKGTATFSDYANEVAAEYGFWLGDAFASGGSVGYDHKKMGITARGAWESVKRHFREMGVDTQSQPFTVVGVGDMSGDVFGNGMLLSRHIRLLAAFDHRHIFIDPNPDPEASWRERERLFRLPRSSWDDYDKTLISEGGGVWSRSAKAITLSEAARAVLGIQAASLAPAELIRAILKAPVDLLYNGGIGTYIKAASESDLAVGDRANDAVRVNGGELRCKVVGEGGNLGVTQLGRIEFALSGGRINTDAIDNSGGVDCSDHEVNIKILLDTVVTEGELTLKQRNALLADMTDEVAALVLRDNYAQTQVLSVMRALGTLLIDDQAEFIRRLSHAGRLNRALEYLPTDEAIGERKTSGVGLVTPELAVLLAHSKIELYDAVLASDVPEDPYISTALERYFPQPLRERFATQIAAHPLRREIISTHVVNSMINRVGTTFVSRLQAEYGASATDVVRAYMATREVFGLVPIWRDIEALDNQVEHAVQVDLIIATGRLVMRGATWFLRHRQWLTDLQATLAHFSPGVKSLAAGLRELVTADYRHELDAAVARYGARCVPEALAARVASLDEVHSALDLVEIAADSGRSEALVGEVYFAIGGRLDLHWLTQQIAALPVGSRWQSLARSALRVELSNQARSLTQGALARQDQGADRIALVDDWGGRNALELARYDQLLADIKVAKSIELPMLLVLLRALAACRN